MSLSDNYAPTKTAGNGSSTTFTWSWNAISASYIEVYSEVIATGVQTLVSSGITVTMNSDGSGTVEFDTAPAATVYIIISRVTPQTQSVGFTTSKGFEATVVEDVVDKLTAQNQEQQDQIDRALTLPLGSSLENVTVPSPTAGRGLKWNDAGDNLINTDADPDTSASAAAASAAAALASENAAAASESSAASDESAAAASAAAAAASAAGVNLPDIDPGDAGKILEVNVGETGYDLVANSGSGALSGDGSKLEWDTASGYVTGLTSSHSFIELGGDFDNRPLINIDATGLDDGHTIFVYPETNEGFRLVDKDVTKDIPNEYGGFESNQPFNPATDAYKESGVFKWGNASLKLDGTDDCLKFNESGSWDFAGDTTVDRTIDFWVKFTDHTGSETIMSQYEDVNNRWILRHVHGSGWDFLVISGGVTVVNLTGGGEISDTDWHHIAVVKKQGTTTNEWAIYLDGTQVNFLDDNSTDTFNGSAFIGQNGQAGEYFDGNIDGFRMQGTNTFSAAPNVGLTDTITVPTAAPVGIAAGTNILLNFDYPNIASKPAILGYGGAGSLKTGALLRWNNTQSQWQCLSLTGNVKYPYFSYKASASTNLTDNTNITMILDGLNTGFEDIWGLLDKTTGRVYIPWNQYMWQFEGQINYTGGSAFSDGDQLVTKLFGNTTSFFSTSMRVQAAISAATYFHVRTGGLYRPQTANDYFTIVGVSETGASTTDTSFASFMGHMI